MVSVLTALYNGDIHPSEDYVPRSKEYKKLDEAFVRASDTFSEKLGKELAEEYESLLDAYSDLFAIQESESFVHGMRLGAKLAVELLTDNHASRT